MMTTVTALTTSTLEKSNHDGEDDDQVVVEKEEEPITMNMCEPCLLIFYAFLSTDEYSCTHDFCQQCIEQEVGWNVWHLLQRTYIRDRCDPYID